MLVQQKLVVVNFEEEYNAIKKSHKAAGLTMPNESVR